MPSLASDRFALVREIGRGGMGVVYEAVDRATGAHVALKLLARADPSALYGFKREFRALSAILHPNLVSPYELVADSDQWFFTMELVPGEHFLAWVRNGRTIPAFAAETPPTLASLVDETRLRTALRQLAIGVAALHQYGLLHRDLKPPNVLVREDGRVAVLDFGLTIDLRESMSTAEHTSGTLAYMAPEQMMGDALGPACDWYAVGIMLFEALTGRTPFGDNARQALFAKSTRTFTPARELVLGVPADLDALCMDLLQSDPDERPSDADVLLRVGVPPAEVHALTGATTVTSGRASAGPQPSLESLFVGRETELATLDQCEAGVRNTGAAIAYVHGRSGAGKSALLQQFLQRARSRSDAVVLAGRCYEQESVPFKAVDAIVDALTRWLLRRSPSEVETLLPPDVDALARVFPVLERVELIAHASSTGVAVPEPRELQRRGFRALRALLSNIGAQAPLVIAIDDLQWGDVDSAELLASIFEHQGDSGPRALFVASFRSEYRESSACLRTLQSAFETSRQPLTLVDIDVRPLDASAALTLATALLVDATMADGAMADDAVPGVAQRIVAASGGNPLFIGELARYAHEHPEWVTDAHGDAFNLDQVLSSRVSRLPLPARELLEIVAIAGQPLRNVFWRDATAATTTDPKALALLRYERLIRSTGITADDEVETYHDRIREAVTSLMSVDGRRDCHLRLGESLERLGGADPETVASHFAAAGAPERAWEHYEEAANLAAHALAFDRAAKLYELALENHVGTSVATRTLLIALGDALANAGRGQQAAKIFERAAELADTTDACLDLQRMAASQYCVGGAIDIGRTLFNEVLRGVGLRPAQSGFGILSQLMVRRTRLRMRGLAFTPRDASDVPPALLRRLDTLWAAGTALSSVDVVGVAALQSQALLLALKAGEPRRLSAALGWEAVMTATSGTKAAARSAELLALSRTLADGVDDRQTHGMSLLSSGWVSFLHTRFDDALTTCAEAEAVFRNECRGVWWELLLARTLLAWGLAHTGRIVELAARMREWEPEARTRGDHFIVTNLLAFPMPHERMLVGDVVGAREHLHEALALWPYEGFHLQHVSVLFSQGMLSLYEGDGVTACNAISAQWSTMVTTLHTQNQQTRVMLRDVRARGALAAAASGIDRRVHLARVERDATSLAGEQASLATAFANRLRAGIAIVHGDESRAVKLLRDTIPDLEVSGLTLQSAAVRRRLGELVGGDEGRSLVTDAESLMHSQGIVDVNAVTRLFAIP